MATAQRDTAHHGPTHHDIDHLHVEGMAADHAEWTVDVRDDDFDASALERAMVAARETAYSELAALDAA